MAAKSKILCIIAIIFDRIKTDLNIICVYHSVSGMPDIVLSQLGTLDIALLVKFKMTAICAMLNNKLTYQNISRFMIFGLP